MRNYALLRITTVGEEHAEDCVDKTKPPVIVIDPRAGHGPGMGGFKRESEIGIALHEGYPVYFVTFFPAPSPHQRLVDVLHTLRRFVDEVMLRHPGKTPILYGNCQGGWVATLVAIHCQGPVGAVVLNGSPLSYWAGASGANPMRLAGGLLGGSWITSFLADLGNGQFDGAWLPGMGAMFGSRVTPMMNLSVEDVRGYLSAQLDRLNNKRLKIGDIKSDEAAITADIITVDNSLVQRLKVDRHTGAIEYQD